MSTLYKNKHRIESKGSQSEKPSLTISEDMCIIKGYQNYRITRENIVLPSHYGNKFLFIQKLLNEKRNSCNTVTDIGASNGIISFIAALEGYEAVYSLDHDNDCISLINKVSSKLSFDNVIAKEYSFGNDHDKTDIVIMGALIHWIYSCTALYGNFDSIFCYLQKITGKYLLIEWVDPNDPAVKYFRHTSFNKDIINEPYTEANFIKSLEKHFEKVEKVLSVISSRRFYLCSV